MAATEIVPRWEWRCFGTSLATVAQAAGMPADAKSRESDEIYLLDMRGSQNAKIRDGVLDIKILHQTDPDGLELWEPVFKASFPVNASDIAAASAIWELPLKALARPSYTVEQFLNEAISGQPDICVANVHKSRRGFSFAGCIAEYVKLTVDSKAVESFSLEQEDPKAILAALATLGLDGHSNTNYPNGLKRSIGLLRQAS